MNFLILEYAQNVLRLVYIWYFIEWICKLPFGNAYRRIGFEQEAYGNEGDSNYVENRHLFCGWLKFVFNGRITYLRK